MLTPGGRQRGGDGGEHASELEGDRSLDRQRAEAALGTRLRGNRAVVADDRELLGGAGHGKEASRRGPRGKRVARS